MAAKSGKSDVVPKYHTDMVTELGEMFATNSREWQTICFQLQMMNHITTGQMGHVKSMHDVSKYLMANNKIYYGRYDILHDVLGRQNVEATRTIDKYTELIRQENEQNGNDNTGETQAVFSQENSEDRKRKAGPSGDREPEVKSKLGNEKRIKVEEDTPYQFRSATDKTRDARIIGVWNNAREAVGRISGPLYGGTGIRVGTKYILTACHVAKDITKENKDDGVDWSKLDSEHVSIEFHFSKKGIKETFYFQGEEPVFNESLDFAILELKGAASEFPRPIAKFGKPDKSQLFALLGHHKKTDSKIMQFDPEVKLFDLNDMNSNRRKYMIENDQEKPGYKGIREKGKVLFDCWVQHGASGAPGIVMGSDGEEPICTLMLVRGFPNQAFAKNVNIPHEEMIEQGVTMEEIAKQTNKKGKRGKMIKKDIFGENFPQQ